MACYATLKLNRAQGRRVPRRQKHHYTPNTKRTIEKQYKQLLRRHPRKTLSGRNNDGEFVTLRIKDNNNSKARLACVERRHTHIELLGTLRKENHDQRKEKLKIALLRYKGNSSPHSASETPKTSATRIFAQRIRFLSS